MRTKEDVSIYMPHFSEGLPPAAITFINEKAFEKSRYIFTEGSRRTSRGRIQTCYCTHCQTTFEAQGYRHGQSGECPVCKKNYQVVAHGRIRRFMINEAYVVWYEKSLIDPQAITARGIVCARDYRGNYRQMKTQTADAALYVFRMGKAVMFKRTAYYSWGHYDSKSGMRVGNYEQAASIHPASREQNGPFFTTSYNRVYACSEKSIRKAIKNTPFQYSCWDQVGIDGSEDHVKFFGLYCVAPCVEYLIKMGLQSLVAGKICNEHTYGTVNWRGKSVTSVLKLEKQHIKALRDVECMVDFDFLRIYQRVLRLKEKFEPKDAAMIAKHFNTYYDGGKDCFDGLLEMANRLKMTVHHTVAYCEKQLGTRTVGHSFFSAADVLRTWRDYLKDCVTLDLNMEDESITMPRNLYQAHQNTIMQIRCKADAELSKRIQAQAKLRDKKFRYVRGGLVAVPAMTAQELIDEGKALNHCVGTYAQRVADGQCVIMFIRKADEPGTSFYTMEVRDGKVFQVRGNKNCNMTPEVAAFVEAFKAEKLNRPTKQKSQRIQIAAMA